MHVLFFIFLLILPEFGLTAPSRRPLLLKPSLVLDDEVYNEAPPLSLEYLRKALQFIAAVPIKQAPIRLASRHDRISPNHSSELKICISRWQSPQLRQLLGKFGQDQLLDSAPVQGLLIRAPDGKQPGFMIYILWDQLLTKIHRQNPQHPEDALFINLMLEIAFQIYGFFPQEMEQKLAQPKENQYQIQINYIFESERFLNTLVQHPRYRKINSEQRRILQDKALELEQNLEFWEQKGREQMGCIEVFGRSSK